MPQFLPRLPEGRARGAHGGRIDDIAVVPAARVTAEQRDAFDQRGGDAGTDEKPHRVDVHGPEGVDLLRDPHDADLGGHGE